MRSDSDIERDVKDELQWDPDLDATDIAVSVKSGVVTLAGYVKSYSDKYEAEVAAKRVAGVSGVANDLEIRVPTVDQRPDPDIARDAVAAIKAYLPVSSENIKVVVQKRPGDAGGTSRVAVLAPNGGTYRALNQRCPRR